MLLQLRNLSEGLYTKKNLQTFLLLISEANAELRLLKLPAYYKSTFPAIKGKLVSELEGTLTNILNFVNTEMDFNFKDPKTKEIKKLNVYLTSQNMPLQNFEKLFKKTKDEENFDKPFSEYMNSTEKKIYTILYGPEGEKQPEIPEDIEMKTSEELEAMGFKAVESLEFEANEKGEIIGDDMNEEKKEKMMEIMKNLADKKEK